MPWPAGTAPAAWLEPEPAGARFTPMLAWLAGAEGPAAWSARLDRKGGGWTVRVREAPPAVGSTDAPFVATAIPDRGPPPDPVALDQVAPGVHEGTLAALGPGGGTVVVHRRGEGVRQRLTAPVLPPAELVRLGVDRARLRAIVRAAGGRLHDAPASFAEVVREKAWEAYRPMDRPLVWAAAVVLLVLAGLRILGRA
jgi:hypothetical protein